MADSTDIRSYGNALAMGDGYDIQGPDPTYGTVDQNPSIVLSEPHPYAEPDRTARTAGIFQGVSGVITTLAGVYQTLRYAPKPNSKSALPPSYITAGAGSVTTNALLPLALIIVGGIVLIFVVRKSR